jgi:hypothetical protein
LGLFFAIELDNAREQAAPKAPNWSLSTNPAGPPRDLSPLRRKHPPRPVKTTLDAFAQQRELS